MEGLECPLEAARVVMRWIADARHVSHDDNPDAHYQEST